MTNESTFDDAIPSIVILLGSSINHQSQTFLAVVLSAPADGEPAAVSCCDRRTWPEFTGIDWDWVNVDQLLCDLTSAFTQTPSFKRVNAASICQRIWALWCVGGWRGAGRGGGWFDATSQKSSESGEAMCTNASIPVCGGSSTDLHAWNLDLHPKISAVWSFKSLPGKKKYQSFQPCLSNGRGCRRRGRRVSGWNQSVNAEKKRWWCYWIFGSCWRLLHNTGLNPQKELVPMSPSGLGRGCRIMHWWPVWPSAQSQLWYIFLIFWIYFLVVLRTCDISAWAEAHQTQRGTYWIEIINHIYYLHFLNAQNMNCKRGYGGFLCFTGNKGPSGRSNWQHVFESGNPAPFY